MTNLFPYEIRPRILCIEDEDDLRADLVEELQEAGYTVIEAVDGEQALIQLRSLRPDLILCDINLPRGNGYEILRAWREQEDALADVPFVFLTALAEPRDVIDGKLAGADDYLVKPIDFDLLLATVQARLRQVDSIRRVTAARPQSHGMTAALQALQTSSFDAGQAQGAQVALDLLSFGVVLLNREGEVLFANCMARGLSEARDGIALDRTLTAFDASANRALRAAVEQALAAPQSQVPVTTVVPREGGQRDLLALAFSLGDAGSATVPAVAVFVLDLEQRSQVPADVLAQLFGLTPTESEVANLLAQGRRSDEVAELLQVSATTVAFHIRNLLSKTHTRRQVDLVALLLAGPMSVRFRR